MMAFPLVLVDLSAAAKDVYPVPVTSLLEACWICLIVPKTGGSGPSVKLRIEPVALAIVVTTSPVGRTTRAACEHTRLQKGGANPLMTAGCPDGFV
jgi:hypothetical protein